MAWIKSYQELERHPKTMLLMKDMGWDLDIAIAKLHRLWWWCGDYAYDGDLERHSPDTVAMAIGMDPKEGIHLIKSLVHAGFLDEKPNLRLHDWWFHFGEYLRGRFSRTPEKWKAVEDCYTAGPHQVPTNRAAGGEVLAIREDKEEKRREEKRREDNYLVQQFNEFWAAYPRKVGKDKAWAAWQTKKPPLAECLKALTWQRMQQQWTKEHGQFIPMPTTYINQGRWTDEPVKAAARSGAAPVPGKYDHFGDKA